MEPQGTSVTKGRTAPEPDAPEKAESPSDLSPPSWRLTARRALAEFMHDQCMDQAAALTYYSVLAIFPALVAVVSLLGVFGQGEKTVDTILELVRSLGQPGAAQLLEEPIRSMVTAQAAGFGLAIGVLGALWSASGYVGAFGRAMNRVYEIDEGRPIWKLRPLQLLLTLVCVLMVALVLVALIVSGPVAQALGDTLGLGGTAVTIWNVAKWPVMLAVVVVIVALLYYATPNIRQPRMRWISVGAGIAILVWLVMSILFGFYVANFGSYNKTYGSLAGVVVFLLWLWLTNVALLFGAEVDSELERVRQLEAGIPAEETLQLPPRDTAKSDKAAAKKEEIVEEGRRIRQAADRAPAQRERPQRERPHEPRGTTVQPERPHEPRGTTVGLVLGVIGGLAGIVRRRLFRR